MVTFKRRPTAPAEKSTGHPTSACRESSAALLPRPSFDSFPPPTCLLLSPPPSSPILRAMDSAVLNQLFRQLFRHPACQCPRSSSILPARRPGTVRLATPPSQQYRTFISRIRRKPKHDESETLYWTRREDYPLDFKETMSYPLVTAKELRRNRERPRRIRMLTREFIDGRYFHDGLSQIRS